MNTDRIALEALFLATERFETLFRCKRVSSWSSSYGWMSAAPLAEWSVVKVDHYGRVIELDIFNNNLKGKSKNFSSPTAIAPTDLSCYCVIP